MSLNYYGKAHDAAQRIMRLFESGNVPAALGPIFIHRGDKVPCRAWSWNNQLLVALAGYDDARGFRQWEEVGRHVRRGEHGFPILVPCHVKREVADAETGETREALALVGFRSCIVFGYEQTDGQPLPDRESERHFLESLPLLDVAKSWGLTVKTYDGRPGGALGWYRPKQAIALGVESPSTWAHELMHAADDRLGTLTERGRHWRSETVAELGSAILLQCLGHEVDADAGGCWRYVSAYARDAGIEPMTACQRVLKRTCDAVALILAEYGRITAGATPETVSVAA